MFPASLLLPSPSFWFSSPTLLPLHPLYSHTFLSRSLLLIYRLHSLILFTFTSLPLLNLLTSLPLFPHPLRAGCTGIWPTLRYTVKGLLLAGIPYRWDDALVRIMYLRMFLLSYMYFHYSTVRLMCINCCFLITFSYTVLGPRQGVYFNCPLGAIGGKVRLNIRTC